MMLSARNHLKGNIEEIKWGDVLAHITVRVGDSVIESVITKRSAEEMGLKKGDAVTADHDERAEAHFVEHLDAAI